VSERERERERDRKVLLYVIVLDRKLNGRNKLKGKQTKD
jgi:hypothetical protein